jgi:hypothetical protein
MRTHSNDRLKGTLDLLVLKTLASSKFQRAFFIWRKGRSILPCIG